MGQRSTARRFIAKTISRSGGLFIRPLHPSSPFEERIKSEGQRRKSSEGLFSAIIPQSLVSVVASSGSRGRDAKQQEGEGKVLPLTLPYSYYGVGARGRGQGSRRPNYRARAARAVGGQKGGSAGDDILPASSSPTSTAPPTNSDIRGARPPLRHSSDRRICLNTAMSSGSVIAHAIRARRCMMDG